MKNESNKLFEMAISNLKEANKELYRPEEDLVSYSVCKHSQYAIENYLKGYLYENGINPSGFKTIQDLFEQCKRLNKAFEKVDLSDFNCQSHDLDSRYCNEISRVSKCFDTADNLDTFFRREKIIR